MWDVKMYIFCEVYHMHFEEGKLLSVIYSVVYTKNPHLIKEANCYQKIFSRAILLLVSGKKTGVKAFVVMPLRD